MLAVGQVIKLHKAIEGQSSLCIKKDFEEVPVGNSHSTRPFVIRKGKNVMKLLFKEDSFRAEVQNGIDKFKEGFEKNSQDKAQAAYA